jgi:catechol-2,3-dioxygenase
MQLDHINISAPMELLQKVKAFYCLVFDLTDGFRPRFSKRGFWLYAGDKPLIHLVESSEHHHNDKQGYLDHVAFQTTGLTGILEKLDANDISYRLSHVPEINLAQVFCTDPCGIGVEINFPDQALAE